MDSKLRNELVAAAEARLAQDWVAAEGHYRAALARDPEQPVVVLQLGHALRETGRLAEAEATYRRAIALRPVYPQGYLYLGHALKLQGRRSAAVDAYAEALGHNPYFKPARDELVAAGARHRLPGADHGRSAATDSLGRISGTLQKGLDEMRHWLTVSTYSVEAYDAFRRAFVIQPPPASEDDRGRTVLVIVDATTATPAAIRRTLVSLLDQRSKGWIAVIRASDQSLEHSVASMQFIDGRLRFVGSGSDELKNAVDGFPNEPMLFATAGSILDREAIGWLEYALSRTRCSAVTCDYDRFSEDWREGVLRFDPVLEGSGTVHDISVRGLPARPVIIGSDIRPLVLELLQSVDDIGDGADVMAMIRRAATVSHLPRILVSLPPDIATLTVRYPGENDPKPGRQTARILVVVPTRDQPELLEACVDSIFTTAARPDMIDVVVVDNRSASPRTHRLFQRLTRKYGLEVLVVDEPFNWSRLNNLAVAARTQDFFLFLNNDVEILTSGWDARLVLALLGQNVGAVGARLLYPDRTVQHAGTILGGHEGRPMHEGVGAPQDAQGPLGRWLTTRPVAAVTGAFMATRRETFQLVGGFDERLSVAYNDIDYCLKVRSHDLYVQYSADIEALHFESVTRGLNNSPQKVAWDDGELADLFRRWGKALFRDPSVNPHWTFAAGRAFDGLREPSLSQVLDYLDASCGNAWAIKAAKVEGLNP